MTQSERRIYLINRLSDEISKGEKIEIPADRDAQKQLLRGLMNIRTPKEADREFLKMQDEYLKEALCRKGITELSGLEPIREGIYLWQGDITTLKCGAIVNAANSGMTGCYVPNHRCIDNAIHTFAGVELRLACAKLMEKQGRPEPTGRAKITPGIQPALRICHSHGGANHKRVGDVEGIGSCFPSCYRSCLELAAQKGIESLAFCCISTGEFHFPNVSAAEIAV